MAGPATILRELHRLRKHLENLQSEIARTPLQLKARQTRLARAEEALRQEQDGIKKLKVESLEGESQLKVAYQLVEKHKKQLNEAVGKKEYDALQSEIAAEKKKCQEIEDRVLTKLAGIEERTAGIPAREEAIVQARKDVESFEQSSKARLAELNAELKRTLEELQTAEQQLPHDVKSQYDRLIGFRKEDALAVVENRTCRACFTEITAQAYNDLVLSQFVLCKNCGRALYLPD